MTPFSKKRQKEDYRIKKWGKGQIKLFLSHLNNGEKLEFVEPQKAKRHCEDFSTFIVHLSMAGFLNSRSLFLTG